MWKVVSIGNIIRDKVDCVYCFEAESELDVVIVGEDESPIERLETALKCLPQYDPSRSFHGDPTSSFRYWKIRDYAYAYRSKLTTPLEVSHLNAQFFLLSLIFLSQTKSLVADC